MTATYTLKVKTPASTINSSGSLRSPEQYGVLCCLLAGQLSDDHKLLKAAPKLLEALKGLFGADMEYCMNMDGKQDQRDAIEAARAALSEATGETA